MFNRKLIAALVLTAASSAVLAAPATGGTQQPPAQQSQQDTPFTEGPGACTGNVEGTARQAAELEACSQYISPHGDG